VGIDYWRDEKKNKKFLEKISRDLQINNPEDWYRVSHQKILELGGEIILRKHGGLFSLLSKYLPEFPWDPKKFQNFRKTQRELFLALNQVFSQFDEKFEVLEDYRDSRLKFPDTGAAIELDIFLPDLNLALEYNVCSLLPSHPSHLAHPFHLSLSLFLPSPSLICSPRTGVATL
jgi:hypothetical protein